MHTVVPWFKDHLFNQNKYTFKLTVVLKWSHWPQDLNIERILKNERASNHRDYCISWYGPISSSLLVLRSNLCECRYFLDFAKATADILQEQMMSDLGHCDRDGVNCTASTVVNNTTAENITETGNKPGYVLLPRFRDRIIYRGISTWAWQCGIDPFVMKNRRKSDFPWYLGEFPFSELRVTISLREEFPILWAQNSGPRDRFCLEHHCSLNLSAKFAFSEHRISIFECRILIFFSAEFPFSSAEFCRVWLWL